MKKNKFTNCKLAIICAHNPKNAGMYSVDLAASQTFSNLGIDFDLFVAQTALNRKLRFLRKFGIYLHNKKLIYGDLSYTSLKNPEVLKNYTHVIYWGDFINNPVYGAGDFTEVDLRWKYASSKKEAFSRWQSIFLPEFSGAPNLASFGGNFQHDFEQVPVNLDLVKQMLSSFSAVAPRDDHSSQNLSNIASSDPYSIKVTNGVDCAFLQNKPSHLDKQQHFCYFFGRSGFSHIDKLIDQLSKLLGLKAINLERWVSLNRDSAVETFAHMRAQINSAQFILTDTYHVCVNSMQSSRPVICLGKTAQHQDGTLGGFKKKQLFHMFKGSTFYIEQHNSTTDTQYYKDVIAEIQKHFPELERKFDTVLNSVRQQKAKMLSEIIRFLEK